MRRSLEILIISSILSFTISCRTEIDLIYDAPTEAVVYGIINMEDEVHQIRVHRIFTVNGNLETNMTPQDIYFDSVNVRISGLVGNKAVWSRDMIRTSLNKDSGYFPTEQHHVYLFEGNLPEAVINSENSVDMVESLRLEVDILDIGVSAKAETCVMSKTVIKINKYHSKRISCYKSPPTSIQFGSTGSNWNCSGDYFELGFKVYISEYGNGIEHQDSIIWKSNTISLEEGSYFLYPERIFNRLMMGIKKDELISSRVIDSIHIFSTIPDGVFSDYWNTRINRFDHDLPPFSNFDKVYGMFFCVSEGYETGFFLDYQSLDSLSNSPQWSHLNFRHW